jgi:hypothetical protein
MIELIKATTDFIKEFRQLSGWIASIVLIALAWKLFLSSMWDKWFSHVLTMRANDISSALAIQKDLAVKKAEFESVKLNKALPLLERANGLIYKHNMLFSEHMRAILNNIDGRGNLENERMKVDTEMIDVLSSLSIYLPTEFRMFMVTLRKMVSCSFRDTKVMCNCLKSIGPLTDQVHSINESYFKTIDCFHSLCGKYVGSENIETTYPEILKKFDFSKDAEPLMNTPMNTLAWKFILLHEYFGSSEQVEAQAKLEAFFASKNSANAAA